MTTRAKIIRRTAPLSSDFGLEYATELFGAPAIADLPRYMRGKKNGKIKAWLIWDNAELGGWDSRYGVCRPGLVHARITGRDQITPLRGTWCGHVNDLSGHRDVLSAEYRERDSYGRKFQYNEGNVAHLKEN